MIPLPAYPPWNCISFLLNTEHRLQRLIIWCSENMGFCCALLVTAYLQFMPYVKHLPFAKAERPPGKQQPALSLGKQE